MDKNLPVYTMARELLVRAGIDRKTVDALTGGDLAELVDLIRLSHVELVRERVREAAKEVTRPTLPAKLCTPYTLTAGMLHILVHYYFSTKDYFFGSGPLRNQPPAVVNAFSRLLHDDLLRDLGPRSKPDPEGRESDYTITPRGRVLVEACLSLPLPVQAWTMPDEVGGGAS